MKVLYMGVLRNEDKPAVELSAETELSSFSRFTRGSIGEFLSMFAKTVAERTKPGQRQDVEEQQYTFHAYARSEGVAGIIITDHEYPGLVAHQLLSKVLDEFLSKNPRTAWANSNAGVPFPQLKEYITKYQDPQQADSIMKVGQIILAEVCQMADMFQCRSRRSLMKPKSFSTRRLSLFSREARRSITWLQSPTA